MIAFLRQFIIVKNSASATGKTRIFVAVLGAIVLLASVLSTTPALAQLPLPMEADRLLLQGRDRIVARDWKGARQSFERIIKLGVRLPADFHYYYAYILSQDGDFKKAGIAVETYLKTAGRSGALYNEALALLTKTRERASLQVRIGILHKRLRPLEAALKKNEANFKSIETVRRRASQTVLDIMNDAADVCRGRFRPRTRNYTVCVENEKSRRNYHQHQAERDRLMNQLSLMGAKSYKLQLEIRGIRRQLATAEQALKAP